MELLSRLHTGVVRKLIALYTSMKHGIPLPPIRSAFAFSYVLGSLAKNAFQLSPWKHRYIVIAYKQIRQTKRKRVGFLLLFLKAIFVYNLFLFRLFACFYSTDHERLGVSCFRLVFTLAWQRGNVLQLLIYTHSKHNIEVYILTQLYNWGGGGDWVLNILMSKSDISRLIYLN